MYIVLYAEVVILLSCDAKEINRACPNGIAQCAGGVKREHREGNDMRNSRADPPL